MDLDEYQRHAQETDRVPSGSTSDQQVELMVPFLGLAGEAGGLLTEFKKHLRDGQAHILFPERPPRQNSCRADRTQNNERAAMKDFNGSIRTSIQGQSGSQVVAT